MPRSDSAYLAHVVSRVVKMFERYAQTIDADNEQLLAYVSEGLKEKGLTDLSAVPYSELYKQVRVVIRRYLRREERPTK